MPFLLAPAHLMGLAAFQLSALLLFVAPRYAAAPLVLFVATCLAAPLFPAFSFYLPILSRGRKGVPGVALTFDDGPDPQVTPLVLDLLDRHGVQATFFVIGSKAQAHPELIRDILARGHAVGNHSQTHPPFLMLMGKRAIAREVGAAQAVLREAGVVPLAFRPPVGITNPDLGRVLLDQGMICVNFSCRGPDLGNRRVAGLARRLLRKARARDIILLHDTLPHRTSVAFLLNEFDQLIQGLEARGLPILSLADALGKPVMAGPAADGPAVPGVPAAARERFAQAFLRLSGLRAARVLLGRLRREHTSAGELAAAVGLGIFVGSLPITPFGLAATVYLCHKLRLNKLAGTAASSLCIAPFVPFLCIQAGHLLLHGRWWTEFNRVSLLREIHLRAWEWLLGSLVVGPLLGAAGALLTYGLARAYWEKGGTG